MFAPAELFELGTVVLPVLVLGAPVLGVVVALFELIVDGVEVLGVFELGEGSGPFARFVATMLEAIASPGIRRDSKTSGATSGRRRARARRLRSRRDRPSGWNRRSELRSRCRTVRRTLCPVRVRPRNHDGRRCNAFNQPCKIMRPPQCRFRSWCGCEARGRQRPTRWRCQSTRIDGSAKREWRRAGSKSCGNTAGTSRCSDGSRAGCTRCVRRPST